MYVSSQRHEPPTVRTYRRQRFSNSGTYRSLYPPQNRRVRQLNPALAQDIHQIARTQFVAEIPPDAEDNDFMVEM
jgi:hypothetical protein